MALRTSATTKFSDARLSAPDPRVKTHRDQTPVSQTAAAAITAFGDLGGQARLAQLESGLREDLGETGNIISTINDPKTQAIKTPTLISAQLAQEEFDRTGVPPLDISAADPDGIIDQTSEAYQSIARGVAQGKITEERAMIQAEVILRKQIARAPGFGDQLRKVAREVLRFDPSGAAVGSLFLSGPSINDPSPPLTALQKNVQKAEAMLAGGAVDSIQEGLNVIAHEEVANAQIAMNNALLATGKQATPKIANNAAMEMTEIMNGILFNAVPELLSSGETIAIENVEQIKRAIMLQRNQLVARQKERMVNNPNQFHAAEDHQLVEDEIDKIVAAGNFFLDNEDVLKVLQKDRDVLRTLFEIEAYNIWPDLMLGANIGPAFIEEYINFMAAVNGDEQRREFMIKNNPKWKALFEKSQTMDLKQIGQALRQLHAGRLHVSMVNGSIDQATADGTITGRALQLADGQIPVEEIIPFTDDLANMPGKGSVMLSTAAATRGSFNTMKPEQRTAIITEWTNGRRQTMTDLASTVANTEFLVAWDPDARNFKGEFNLVRRDGEPGQSDTSRARTFGFEGPMTAAQMERFEREPRFAGETARAALNIANHKHLDLIRDPNWAKAAGVQSVRDWANDFILDVNSRAIDIEANQTPGDVTAGGNISALSVGDQVKLRQAFQTGDINHVMDFMRDELGLGDFGVDTGTSFFNKGINESLPPEQLERFSKFELGDQFLDTSTGQIMRMMEEGQIEVIGARVNKDAEGNKTSVPQTDDTGTVVRDPATAPNPDRSILDPDLFNFDPVPYTGTEFASADFNVVETAPDSLTGVQINVGADPNLVSFAEAVARDFRIPPSLMIAQIQQESRWDINAVSSAGAKGLGQFTDQTSEEFSMSNPFNPIANIMATGAYMNRLKAQFGTWQQALAAYNWGPGNLAGVGGDLTDPTVPTETTNYIKAILANARAGDFGE